MNRFCVLCCALVSCACSAFGASHGRQDLIQPSSWIYDALTAIALEEGRTDLSMQAPISVAELDALLAECDPDALSSAGRDMYQRIMDWRGEQNLALTFGLFSVGMTPSVNLELYLKSEESVPFVYDYHKRRNLLEVPVQVRFGDWASIETVIKMGIAKTHSFDNSVWCNIPLKAETFRDGFPHDAYFSTGCSFAPLYGMNFQIGQGSGYVGRSLTGSVVRSQYMTETPYANLAFYSPSLRYDLNVQQLDVARYYYTHRIAFRFFKKVQFGFSESLLVPSALELRYLNPLIIFHTFTPWADYEDTCDVMTITLSYTPVRFVRVYFSYSQDEWQFPGEADDADVTPNGMCYQAGAESYLPLGDGHLHLWLEGTYSLPFMGIKPTPNATMVHVFDEQVVGKRDIYEWIGSPFGPDTLSASLFAEYSAGQKWSVSLQYLFLARGELSGTALFDGIRWGAHNTEFSEKSDDYKNWKFPKAGETDRKNWVAPHGVVQYENRITVSGQWQPVPWLTAVLSPSLVFVSNLGHQSGMGAFSIEGDLSLRLDLARLLPIGKR